MRKGAKKGGAARVLAWKASSSRIASHHVQDLPAAVTHRQRTSSHSLSTALFVAGHPISDSPLTVSTQMSTRVQNNCYRV